MSQTAHMRDPRKTVPVAGCFGATKDFVDARALRYLEIWRADFHLVRSSSGHGYREYVGRVDPAHIAEGELDERDIALLVCPELCPGGASVWLDRQTGEFCVRESIID